MGTTYAPVPSSLLIRSAGNSKIWPHMNMHLEALQKKAFEEVREQSDTTELTEAVLCNPAGRSETDTTQVPAMSVITKALKATILRQLLAQDL
jgi:hypothetical protein